jgi:ABC-type antimicrobial peptide transport system permease subunit
LRAPASYELFVATDVEYQGGASRSLVAAGLLPVLVGTLAGLGSAALLVRAVHGLVHGVSALDPFSYATAGLLMLAGSAAAAAMAAARLGRASPTEALRAE